MVKITNKWLLDEQKNDIYVTVERWDGYNWRCNLGIDIAQFFSFGSWHMVWICKHKNHEI